MAPMAAILNFPMKKWTKKLKQFLQSSKIKISEKKTQLLKIYMKSHMTYICYKYILYTFYGHYNPFLAGIASFSFLSPN